VHDTALAEKTAHPCPPGPYRFVNREYVIITYRAFSEKLRALVLRPLVFDGAIVKYEFIRMQDSTGFSDYTETGQRHGVSANAGKTNPAKLRNVSEGLQSIRRLEMSVGDQHDLIA